MEALRSHSVTAAVVSAVANQTTVQLETYYAFPAGQAKAVIDDEIAVVRIHDDRFELHPISERPRNPVLWLRGHVTDIIDRSQLMIYLSYLSN